MKRSSKRNANQTDSTQSILSQRRRALSKLLVLLNDDHRRIVERDDELRTAEAGATTTTGESLPESLRRLRLGQVTVAEYLDIKVDQAMARVQGLIPADDFRHLRAIIRERVGTDPVLVALVQRLSSAPRSLRNHR
jgi:hypothetical protein